MKNPSTYFVQRNGAEEGPFTTAQINRMKQKGSIAADTPCRASEEQSFRRLDAVFPHLKEYKADPEKMARIKNEVSTYEIKSLVATAFGSGLLFWAPLGAGPIASLTAIGAGLVLLSY
ncbi:DUF4339 domain-containing protein [Verrucomicrobiota bacterium sgz303538]